MKRAWTGLLLALLLLPAGVTAGEIRKWVDAGGRVHFGDDATAPGRSETVRPRRGNFLGGGHSAATTAGADDAPSSWSHAARSEILPAAPGVRPVKGSAAATAASPAAATGAAPAPAAASAPAASTPAAGSAAATRVADAGGPDCVPIEYKKISATTGQIVRMRRLPCQPGVAPVEIGPY